MVIIVGGIMVAAVVMFVRGPFQSYLETARHEQLNDTVDSSLRRIGRDLRVALPNSIRVTQGATTCIEMLPTIMGGRYRAAVDNNGNGDILDFTLPAGDTSFDMFGAFSAVPGQTPVATDLVVVYNLGTASPAANAYTQNNTAVIKNTGAGSLPNESKITFVNATLFPLASPNNRFQVIGPANTGAVSYVCTPVGTDASGNGTGTLKRVFGYPIAPAQACPPAGGTTTLLANNVTVCTIQYSPAGPTNTTARDGLVEMTLQVTQNNESVYIYDEVHVNNAP